MYPIIYTYFLLRDKENFHRYADKPVGSEIIRFLNHFYGPGTQNEVKAFEVEDKTELGEVFRLLELDRILFTEAEKRAIIEALRKGYTLKEALGSHKLQRFLTVLTYQTYPKKDFRIIREIELEEGESKNEN